MTKMKKHVHGEYPYKMIFSDIDGTLLNSAHQVTEDIKRKILELERVGIPFVLVSGRMPDAMLTIKAQIGNHAPMVCYNGGLIFGEKNEKLYECKMDLKQALEIKKKMGREFPQICCNTYGYNKWIVDDDENPWVVMEEKITALKSQKDKVEAVFAGKGIHKLLIMGENEVIKKVEASLRKEFPLLFIIASTPNSLEVVDGKAKKSNGVRFLCNHYGITTQDAIAFGDGHNDIDMLTAVKRSYAMANAPQEVKNSATHLAPDNDHEGILKVLQELFP
jgi:Cof subfamily protein (haloacid dehalogenase superfamily)